MMHAIPTPIAAEPCHNALLAAVPPADMARWSQHLEPVELRAGQVLFDAGTRVTHLYFPVTAILALLNVMEDGGSAESSVVGREGLAGTASVPALYASAYHADVADRGVQPPPFRRTAIVPLAPAVARPQQRQRNSDDPRDHRQYAWRTS